MSGEFLKIEALKATNYYAWRTNMEAALKLKDLWAPVVESASWEALEEEKRKTLGEKARALMLIHISSSLKTLISQCDSAKSAWETLEIVFHTRSAGRKFALRSQLLELRRGCAVLRVAG